MNKKIFGIFIILLGLLVISFIVYIIFFSSIAVPLPTELPTITTQPEIKPTTQESPIVTNKIKINLFYYF